MYVRLLFCSLLAGALALGAPVPARASTPPPQGSAKPTPPQLTPEQLAAIRKQNQVLVRYAAAIANMIDRGQIAQVWRASSQVARKAIPEVTFVKATQADRAQLGTVTSRKVQEITRGVSNGTTLPGGYYVNINFATTFSKYPKPVRELVSFHLDQDRTWRLSGYTVR